MPEAEVRMSEEKIGVPEALTSLIPAIKPCNCAVKDKIEREVNGKGWRIDELVGIPSATHGYIDSQTGKQVGSFMTYLINFNVNADADNKDKNVLGPFSAKTILGL